MQWTHIDTSTSNDVCARRIIGMGGRKVMQEFVSHCLCVTEIREGVIQKFVGLCLSDTEIRVTCDDFNSKSYTCWLIHWSYSYIHETGIRGSMF